MKVETPQSSLERELVQVGEVAILDVDLKGGEDADDAVVDRDRQVEPCE